MEIVDAHMHFWTPATHPWVEDVKDGGHPAGKFGKKCTGTKNSTQIHFLEQVATYMPQQYKQDTEGYNVSTCVHVEANWPGAPEGETKQVTLIQLHYNLCTLLGGWRR